MVLFSVIADVNRLKRVTEKCICTSLIVLDHRKQSDVLTALGVPRLLCARIKHVERPIFISASSTV